MSDYSALERLRRGGWRVAVHNDYMLGGMPHTFWLFTRGDLAAKGEGKSDGEALLAAEAEAHRVLRRNSPHTEEPRR